MVESNVAVFILTCSNCWLVGEGGFLLGERKGKKKKMRLELKIHQVEIFIRSSKVMKYEMNIWHKVYFAVLLIHVVLG